MAIMNQISERVIVKTMYTYEIDDMNCSELVSIISKLQDEYPGKRLQFDTTSETLYGDTTDYIRIFYTQVIAG